MQAKTSSYFPPGEAVPPGYEFLARDLRALSVQPLVAAGRVTGLLLTADAEPGAPDPTVTAAMELLASADMAVEVEPSDIQPARARASAAAGAAAMRSRMG